MNVHNTSSIIYTTSLNGLNMVKPLTFLKSDSFLVTRMKLLINAVEAIIASGVAVLLICLISIVLS